MAPTDQAGTSPEPGRSEPGLDQLLQELLVRLGSPPPRLISPLPPPPPRQSRPAMPLPPPPPPVPPMAPPPRPLPTTQARTTWGIPWTATQEGPPAGTAARAVGGPAAAPVPPPPAPPAPDRRPASQLHAAAAPFVPGEPWPVGHVAAARPLGLLLEPVAEPLVQRPLPAWPWAAPRPTGTTEELVEMTKEMVERQAGVPAEKKARRRKQRGRRNARKKAAAREAAEAEAEGEE